MANNCEATIIFSGDNQTLENIKNSLITTNKWGHNTISFALVEPLVPSIRDNELFKMVGCDYYEFITSEEGVEKQKVWDKVSNFLEKNNWIDLRDSYINNVWNTEVISELGKLTLNLEMPWYCPTKFFERVANQYKVELVLIERVEGNFTHMTYQENDKYITIKTDLNHSLTPNFIINAINCNYLEPAEFLLAAIYNRNDSLAKELLKEYAITELELNTCVNKIINDEHVAIFGTSLFAEKLCKDEDFPEKLINIKNESINFINLSTQTNTKTNSLRFKF